MVNEVDYYSLTNYFTQILKAKMKKSVLLVCIVKFSEENKKIKRKVTKQNKRIKIRLRTKE